MSSRGTGAVAVAVIVGILTGRPKRDSSLGDNRVEQMGMLRCLQGHTRLALSSKNSRSRRKLGGIPGTDSSHFWFWEASDWLCTD